MTHENTHLKVVVFSKYGRLGASSRLRMLQYLPWMKDAELAVTVHPLLSDEMLSSRYKLGGYGVVALLIAYFRRARWLIRCSKFDVLWVEKESLPWMPFWLERYLLRGIPYVLDYDDAVFHQYDMSRHLWVRRLYGDRLDRLMAGASLVVGGNSYLAQRAVDAGAKKVEVLPTVIDIDRYQLKTESLVDKEKWHSDVADVPLIVWIGSPSTVKYLELLQIPLQVLAEEMRFKLRVIGGEGVEIPGIDVELVKWSEDTEVNSISECDVGVMPLLDSPWERGKCGYKLIQYMACSLPVVASNVGVNPEIVVHGKNGFLASTPDEWVIALRKLLSDGALRESLGQFGRQRVENEFCVQQTGVKMAGLLRDAAMNPS